jgi:hypothetical protein
MHFAIRPHQINFLFVGPPARKKASSRFFSLLNPHQSPSRPHLPIFTKQNLYSFEHFHAANYAVIFKRIFIEKIMHVNTMADMFVASVVSPVKILLCNTAVECDPTFSFLQLFQLLQKRQSDTVVIPSVV